LNHPFCLFFYSWPRPNRERKLQLTPPGWTYQGRLWFLIYIPCSQNENISREIYMYTHFIYMYWMYWYCMDILFIYIYICLRNFCDFHFRLSQRVPSSILWPCC
jgi:hypothetical protein